MKRTKKKKNTTIDIGKLGDKARCNMQATGLLGVASTMFRNASTAWEQGQLTQREHSQLIVDVAKQALAESRESPSYDERLLVAMIQWAERMVDPHTIRDRKCDMAKALIMAAAGYCRYHNLPLLESLKEG